MPGEPIFRVAGGSGFESICAAVSVMPIVSTIGTPNRVSKAVCTSGAKAELADLPKRSFALAASLGS